jgi:inhibitor of KinA
MKWTPVGPRAALVEFAERDSAATRDRARAIQRLLLSATPASLTDFTVAFDKVLLEFPEPIDKTSEEVWTRKFTEIVPVRAVEARLHEIPVRYDGPDLADLAVRCGLTAAEVISRHTAPLYDVALLGFSPGFPYLDGLDPRLHSPRKASPRSRVPAGSVAIGGSHTGIYSVESPGGWNLIGATEARLFDPARRTPDESAMFLLRAGDRVKFIPVE